MTTQQIGQERAVLARSGRAKLRRGWWLGYVFIAPWLISFLAFDLIPIVSGFYHSFTQWTATGSQATWIGLANYDEAINRDPLFWISIR